MSPQDHLLERADIEVGGLNYSGVKLMPDFNPKIMMALKIMESDALIYFLPLL